MCKSEKKFKETLVSLIRAILPLDGYDSDK